MATFTPREKSEMGRRKWWDPRPGESYQDWRMRVYPWRDPEQKLDYTEQPRFEREEDL